MHRRQFLGAAGAGTGAAIAGCLGLGSDSSTALGSPDREADGESLPYPTHGEDLPEATLPSPLHDREVTTTGYVGERETLLTFVFTNCPGPCHSLTASLAHVQVDAAENGYDDAVALLPVTFDPDRDTPDEIRSFSASNGADPDADNWQFLRPDSPGRAQDVVGDTFGVHFEEVAADEGAHEEHDDGTSGDDTGDGGDPETTFVHTTLLLLVNRDGYVERAYDREPPRPDEVLEDLRTVRDEFA